MRKNERIQKRNSDTNSKRIQDSWVGFLEIREELA